MAFNEFHRNATFTFLTFNHRLLDTKLFFAACTKSKNMGHNVRLCCPLQCFALPSGAVTEQSSPIWCTDTCSSVASSLCRNHSRSQQSAVLPTQFHARPLAAAEVVENGNETRRNVGLWVTIRRYYPSLRLEENYSIVLCNKPQPLRSTYFIYHNSE
jgi:hypothetical protein